MKQILYVIAFALVLVAPGCNLKENPFVGAWTGPWSVPAQSNSGTVTVVVIGAGDVNGNVTSSIRSDTAICVGTLPRSGHFTLTVTYPSPLTVVTLTGTAHMEGGHIIGTFTQNDGAFGSFNLSPN